MRIGLSAMTAALERFFELGYSRPQASLYESFLTAKMVARIKGDEEPNVADVNDVVLRIFGLAPDRELGRLYPFRYDWKGAVESGRRTVWNNTTRNQTNLATTIFERGDFRGGLLPDAARRIAESIRGGGKVLPPRQALVCLVLHDHQFSPGDDWEAAEHLLLDRLGMSPEELEAITEPATLGEPLLGEPEWDIAELPDRLAPTAAAEIVGPGVNTPVDPTAATAVVVDPRVKRMLMRSIERYPCILLVGPPGTGKGRLLSWLVQTVADDPASLGFDAGLDPNPMWRTPDESWTAFDLIGGLLPGEGGSLQWSRGLLLNCLAENRWLVLDETNRADMDKIMGPLLTWLSGQEVEVGRTDAASDTPIHLAWGESHLCTAEDPGEVGVSTRFVAGRDWRLLGTYNPLDAQRVFRFGLALTRRFVTVPIPAMLSGQFENLLGRQHPHLSTTSQALLGGLYEAHLGAQATSLGPAVFLRMAQYLAGPDGEAEPEDDGEPEGGDAHGADQDGGVPQGGEQREDPLVRLVAEAYMLSVGKYLATYDNQTVEKLRERLIASEHPMAGEATWTWILKQRAVLG